MSSAGTGAGPRGSGPRRRGAACCWTAPGHGSRTARRRGCLRARSAAAGAQREVLRLSGVVHVVGGPDVLHSRVLAAQEGAARQAVGCAARNAHGQPQAAADLIGAGAAGLAAAQAFRSQLPQDAAEYVRLNVLPRPAQPASQIIGRPSDVERLLDEAGQRAQEVERGAEAIEETAVAAEEGEVAVAAEGVGGAFGYLGGLAEGAAALAPTAGEVAGTLAGAAATAGAVCSAAQTVRDGGRPLPVAGQGAGLGVSRQVVLNKAGSAVPLVPPRQPHVLVRGLCGSAEAVLGNCLQRRVLQGPGVGVLAGLHISAAVRVNMQFLCCWRLRNQHELDAVRTAACAPWGS